MKYIDAEKLYEYLEQVSEFYPRYADNFLDNAVINVINGIKTFIASLQQEQPEVDLAEEITKFFSENPIPHEHITDWPLLKNTALHFFNHGLNARKDKLPEIELDKFTEKIKTFQGRYKYPEILSIKGAMAFMARMFYQYPNVARMWYDRLPKTTMD